MIGLFPPDLKIERKDLADMTLELAGFYDDHHKDIVIIDRPVTIELPDRYRNAVTEMRKLDTMGTLGHELTHALQDQHFDIERRAEEIQGQYRSRARLQGDRRRRRDPVGIFGGDGARGQWVNRDFQFASAGHRAGVHGTDGRQAARDDLPIYFSVHRGRTLRRRSLKSQKMGRRECFVQRAAAIDATDHASPRLYFDHPTPALTVKLAGYKRFCTIGKKWTRIRSAS